MSMVLESGYTSINKKNEELCGDKVETVINNGYSTLVLADGLGSGVKANILATLTSKILCTMIANDIDIEECVETILQSLPVCKVRGVAYSTFSIIHINEEGKGYLLEFDNPEAIYFHKGKCCDFEREKLFVLDKVVYKTRLQLEKEDIIIIISDGVIHAGMGITLNFGWQREDVIKYLNKNIKSEMSARCVSWLLTSACNDLYVNSPGDDTTTLVIKAREEEFVDIMVGPPVDKSEDNFYISKFMKRNGKKVVCGGTSSQIVAKYLGKEVQTELNYVDKELPPIGYIDGINLTTEGVLTLRKLLELSEKYLCVSDLSPKYFDKHDGASKLADILFEKATDITFFVGQSMNKAHEGLPIDITMKLKLVDSLAKNLKIMGKKVSVNYD